MVALNGDGLFSDAEAQPRAAELEAEGEANGAGEEVNDRRLFTFSMFVFALNCAISAKIIIDIEIRISMPKRNNPVNVCEKVLF